MATTYAQRNHFTKRPARFKAKAEPRTFAELMRQAAQELKFLSAEVHLVEREIEEFNRFYYAEVGALYEAYKQARDSARIEDRGEEFPAPDTLTKPEKASKIMTSLSKKVFRRVAKICHPDSAKTKENAEFFVKLNDAYQAQDLGSLLLLEQHLLKGFNPENTRYLEEQFDMIEYAKEALDKRKADLVNSPAYKLRQKIFWAKMGGQDLMAQIKRHLERQIAALKFNPLSVV